MLKARHVRNGVEVFLLGNFFSSNTKNIKIQVPVPYPQGEINSLDTMLRIVWQSERFLHPQTGDAQTTVTRSLPQRSRS